MKRAVLLAFLVLLPSTAKAQVAVLGFEAEPGAEKMASWVSRALRFWLKARGKKLGPEKDGMEVKLVYGCDRERPKCMAKIAKAMAVRKLIFGKVRRQGKVYVVVIKALDMKRPKNLDTMSKRVQVKGASYPGVKNIAVSWIAGLLGKSTTGTLVIKGSPVGALVVVDGKQVGPLPSSGSMELSLPKGRHKVTLQKEGFKTLTRSVKIRMGGRRVLRVQLKEGPGGGTPPTRVEPRVVTRPGDGQGAGGGTEPPIEKKKEKSNPKMWWQIAFYSSAGVAGALLLASIFTGRRVADLEGDKTARLKDIRSSDPNAGWISASDVCKTSTDPKIDSICKDGKKYANMTNAFLITGGVFAAAAGVLSYFAFVRDYDDDEEPTPEGARVPKKTPVRVSATPVMYGTSGAGVNVRLDF